MTALAEVKSHALRLFGKGEVLHALRLYDAIVTAAPLDYEARLKVGDCLAALGHRPEATEVLRAVGVEPTVRSLLRRRDELLEFLRSALVAS